MPAVAEKKPTSTSAIAPFVLEVDTGCNGPAILYCSPGLQPERLRGRWSRRNMKTMDTMISEGMGQLHDDIPGLQIRVTPRHRSLLVFDPLETDADLMAKINVAAKADRLVGTQGYMSVKSRQTTLSEDEFKTVLIRFRNALGTLLSVVEGEFPSAEQIESLPGRRLAFNGSQKGPKYHDQTETWQQMMEAWSRRKEF